MKYLEFEVKNRIVEIHAIRSRRHGATFTSLYFRDFDGELISLGEPWKCISPAIAEIKASMRCHGVPVEFTLKDIIKLKNTKHIFQIDQADKHLLSA